MLLSGCLGAACSATKDEDDGASQSSLAATRLADGKEWTTENLSVHQDQSYCYDDSSANCRKYGRLYTWEAAKRGCESLGGGFRLPTDAEWRRLAKVYGGIMEDSDDEGKAAYQRLLRDRATDFNASMGGNRTPGGQYERLEAHGFYWTSSEGEGGGAVFYNFGKGGLALNRQPGGEKEMAVSVRCIRE